MLCACCSGVRVVPKVKQRIELPVTKPLKAQKGESRHLTGPKAKSRNTPWGSLESREQADHPDHSRLVFHRAPGLSSPWIPPFSFSSPSSLFQSLPLLRWFRKLLQEGGRAQGGCIPAKEFSCYEGTPFSTAASFLLPLPCISHTSG